MSNNKKVIAENIRYYMSQKGIVRKDLCDALGFKYSTVTDWPNAEKYPRIDKIEKMAAYFGVSKSDLVEEHTPDQPDQPRAARIKVYGSVPAGVPLEAIEDVVDWEDIPASWQTGDKVYFGLRVKGDSMYPKYQEGDTIICLKQPDCESGQDAIVYVNGYEATLKRVNKEPGGIVLQPLNPSYSPRFYSYDDARHPVAILGIVVEIRRRVN